jgi:hypothetical protein
MAFRLSVKQVAAMIIALIVVATVSTRHKELRAWFRTESFQGAAESPFGAGLPSWATGAIFGAIGVGILLVYFVGREVVYAKQEKTKYGSAFRNFIKSQ